MSIAPVTASRPTTPTPKPSAAPTLPAGPDYFTLPTDVASKPPVGMIDLLTGLADIATSAKTARNWGQDRMHDAIPWPLPKATEPPVDPIIQPAPKYV